MRRASLDTPSLASRRRMGVVRNQITANLYRVTIDNATVSASTFAGSAIARGTRVPLIWHPERNFWEIEHIPAASGHLLITGLGATFSSTLVTYMPIDHGSGGSTPQASWETTMPVAGTISHGKVTLNGAPGAGTSYTFDVLKNSVAGMSMAVADTATEAEDTASVISVVAGDRVVIRSTPAGTPAARQAWFTFKFTPATSGECVLLQADRAISLNATATRYNRFGSNIGSWQTLITARTNVWAIEATFTNWRVDLRAAPGTGRSYTFTLMKNGVAEASSSITIADSAVTGSATISIAQTAGTIWTVRCVPSGTPTVTQAAWSLAYRPTTAGQWNVCGDTSGVAPSDPAYEWMFGQVGWQALQATGTRKFVVATGSINPTISKMVYDLDIAPGAGNSFSVNVLKNGIATDVGVTVTDTATTASDVGSAAFTDDDDIVLSRTGWPGSGSSVDRWAFVVQA